MSELESLKDTSQSPFVRALIKSADRDAPTSGAITKVAAALGVQATLLTTTTASAAATQTALWAAVLKPLLIGAASGLVAVTVVHEHSRTEAPPKARSAIAVAQRALPTAAPRQPAAAQPTPETSEPIPSQQATDIAPRPAVARSSTPSAPAAKLPPPAASLDSVSIAEELASIDRARQAIRAGHASEALRELRAHRAAWPNGVLATEASVLVIEAHLALGDRSSALQEARAFLAARPTGRYAERVRTLFKPSELE